MFSFYFMMFIVPTGLILFSLWLAQKTKRN